MKRILLALPLAGAMMTAHAQSTAPATAAEATTPAEEHDRSVTRPRGDCVDLSEGIAPTQSARDLHDSLDDEEPHSGSPDAEAGTSGGVDTDGKRNRLGSADIEQASPPGEKDGENRASC